ncbi:UNVERIFIED_CONTAM: hypothetical protein Sangu_3153500 [Sesamum angustifolium]|uniref:Endonuclease/exonuclease/phosphatase domain-containing protein n=1 Tax=Sesamum angustifolium TaxID=2727405 RepID=A0AAW2JV89_9LAMI
MSQNSLCCLTHTTPSTHTIPSHAPAAVSEADEGGIGDFDDGEHGTVSDTPVANSAEVGADPATDISAANMMDDRDDGPVIDGEHGNMGYPNPISVGIGNRAVLSLEDQRIVRDFNIKEFLSHANRVIDDRDKDSIAALDDLKRRWLEKYGDDAFKSPVVGGGMRPVASRPGTTFPPPPMRLPRHAQKTLTPETLAPPPRVSLDQERAPPPSGIVVNPTRVLPRLDDEDIAEEEPINSVPTMPADTADPKPNELPAAGSNIPIPSTGLFIVNVPLYAHSSDFSSCDKFAASFNNSTRRTWSYVSPSIQNGKVIVRPSIDVVREGSRRWDSTAVGYFLGRKPYYHHLNEYVGSVWPAVKVVTATSNCFYFFQFKMEVAMEEVIEGGPWLFHHPSKVEPGMWPANRIWIASDDELLDVDVLNLDAQFIHCRIIMRSAHLSVLATVVYGANDSVSRRGLWQNLVMLAQLISDEPWIVGGDFNTVLDMSEVCGASADIHLAMNDFRDCILDTGLIHLPWQGERFSWQNCSEGDRSLWKQLDRFLVNDAWLDQWPNSHYHCLNAWTSDHSLL